MRLGCIYAFRAVRRRPAATTARMRGARRGRSARTGAHGSAERLTSRAARTRISPDPETGNIGGPPKFGDLQLHDGRKGSRPEVPTNLASHRRVRPTHRARRLPGAARGGVRAHARGHTGRAARHAAHRIGNEFAATLLWEDEYVVAMPLGHPLAKRDHVTLVELAGEDLIAYRENSALRLRLEAKMAEQGLPAAPRG